MESTTINMTGRLQNKIAVVTGASSGIGRATCLAFAAEGALIVCGDIREEPRPQKNSAFNKADAAEDDETPTHEMITKAGGKAVYQKCDTGSAADIEALVARAVKEFGRLDIMFNNAGIAPESHKPLPIWEAEEETWDQTLNINTKGVMLGCKFAAKQMITQEPHAGGDRGWIVNTASICGLLGTPRTCKFPVNRSILSITPAKS